MTITTEVREKVVMMHFIEGYGRNKIAQILNEQQQIKISQGSVGNIIRAAQLPLQSNTNINNTNSPPSGTQPEADATISTGIDMSNIDSTVSFGVGLAVIPRDGGPLSHLLNEDLVNPDSTNLSQKSVDFDNKPYPEFYPVESEEEVETSNPKLLGTWDPDSDDAWDRRFLRIVMDDKRSRQQDIQLIEQKLQEIRDKEQQIDQRENDLKTREAKLNEIKPLLPSVRELQSNGITFDLIMSYLFAVNEKSALENITVKQAAYNILHDFRDYRNLGGLKKIIEDGEKQLEALGPFLRENQRAIADLIYLRRAGCGKRDFKRLGEVIRGQRLDTELVDVGTPKNNGSSHPTYLSGNGNNSLSMNNYLRLQLLQASTSNILNKMGVKN